MAPVTIQGTEVELVSSCMNLGMKLDDMLDWSSRTEAAHKKEQRRLYFLRLQICRPANKLMKRAGSTVECRTQDKKRAGLLTLRAD